MEEKEKILEEIEQLKKRLEELNDSFIDFELPKNYDKMTKEEQKAYHKKQEKLKKAALEDMSNYSVVSKNCTMVSYPENRTIVNSFKRDVGVLSSIPLERDTFKRTTPEKVKQQHRKDLKNIEKLIERYNSTKAIRNDKVEFGANFENFAGTYFNKQACSTLDRLSRKNFLLKYDRQQDKNGNMIGDQFKFQNLTEEQRKDLIKIRIKLFAEKLAKIQEIAEKKVRIDSKQKMSTFSEKHGFMNNRIAYRNATRKFTTAKSVVSKSGIDMSNKKRKKSSIKHDVELKSNRDANNKSRLIELNIMREKFDKFVANYKGNGRQFSIEFEQNFPEIANKLYKQKTKDELSFRSQNLASSPISVQHHEINKQFDDEFRKVNYRLRYASYYIPTSTSNCGGFLGKALTNAKTQTEKNLDAMRVKEYEKELKNIALREDLVSYDNIIGNTNKTIQKEFSEHIKKNQKDFDKKSEISKKSELKSFISQRIERLKENVHKNKFFSLGTEKLERLSGVLIDRADKIVSKEVKNVFDVLGVEQGEKYKSILQAVKESTTKYNNEKITIDKLSEKLEKLNRNPYSVENTALIKKTMDEINSRNKKLAIIKSTLDGAIQKKNVFESNFAEKQISKSMESTTTKAVVFNTAKSVFDKYAFPAIDAFGEKYYIERNSLEGKQVEKLVSTFIMNFKNQVQNLKISFGDSEDKTLREFVEKLTEKLEDDFGAIIRDLKKTQKFLISNIEKAKNDKNNSLQTEFEKYVQRLSKIESELIRKLKAMNIEIGDVTLAKNKK